MMQGTAATVASIVTLAFRVYSHLLAYDYMHG